MLESLQICFLINLFQTSTLIFIRVYFCKCCDKTIYIPVNFLTEQYQLKNVLVVSTSIHIISASYHNLILCYQLIVISVIIKISRVSIYANITAYIDIDNRYYLDIAFVLIQSKKSSSRLLARKYKTKTEIQSNHKNENSKLHHYSQHKKKLFQVYFNSYTISRVV